MMVAEESYDVLVIGGGLSACSTIAEFAAISSDEPVRIALVDDQESVGGKAYGPRSGSACLTLTSIEDFLPEIDRAPLVSWLGDSLKRFEELPELPGPFSPVLQRWIDNQSGYSDDPIDWTRSGLPRRLFGHYLDFLLSQTAQNPLCEVNLYQGVSVKSVEHEADTNQLLVTTDSQRLRAKKVLIAIGSGTERTLFDYPSPTLIEDPYHPGIVSSLETIGQLRRNLDGLLEIMIVGGNASTLDLLTHFALSDLEDYAITVVAPSGISGSIYPSPQPPVEWKPSRLTSLSKATTVDLTCGEVSSAFLEDLDELDKLGHSVSQVLPALNQAMITCVLRLPAPEQQEFASFTGVKIGRHTRKITPEVARYVDRLKNDGHLTVVDGRFDRVCLDEDNRHQASWSSQDTVHGGSFDLIINCTGFEPAMAQSSPLVVDMESSGLIELTPCGRGIKVDDDLNAGANISVLGPLLAGNTLSSGPIWHVEHAGRLMHYSRVVAAQFDASLGRQQEK